MTTNILARRANFKICQPLGEGRSSRVFSALRVVNSALPPQEVVLKILKNEINLADFGQELARISGFRSAYFASIYCYEKVGHQVALVMEPVDGISLARLLKHQPVAEPLVREIGAQLQRGMNELWDEQLVHGDISLSNILVDNRGQVKIIDYCLTSEAGPGIHATAPFAAPELSSTGPTREADIFALGKVLQILLPTKHRRDAPWSVLIESALEPEAHLRKLRPELQLSKASRQALGHFVKQCQAKEVALKAETEIIKSKDDLSALAPPDAAVKLVLFLALLMTPLHFSSEPVMAQKKTPLNLPYAQVSVRSAKWMKIYIDRQFISFTPVEGLKLSPGRHSLSWQAAGGKSGEVTLTLREGENRLILGSKILQGN